MKYPYTKISRCNTYENGARVYAVWRYLASDNASIKGVITKTPWGTWRIDLNCQCGHHETELLSQAKWFTTKLLA